MKENRMSRLVKESDRQVIPHSTYDCFPVCVMQMSRRSARGRTTDVPLSLMQQYARQDALLAEGEAKSKPKKRKADSQTSPTEDERKIKELFQMIRVQSMLMENAIAMWERKVPMLIATATGNVPDAIPYVYSVGLPHLLGTGEIAMSSMSHEQSMDLLNNLYRAFKTGELDKKVLADGGTIPAKTIANVEFRVRLVPDPGTHCVQAIKSTVMRQHHACPGFGQVFQILWPDKSGSFEHAHQLKL